MNILILTGNLGNDAEQRFTQSGDSVVSFSLPAKSGFGDKAITSWVKCVVWGKRGESVFPYLKKGQMVGIQGEFVAREWQDKDEQKRISNEVRVNDVQLLGKKSDSTGAQNQSSQPASKAKPSFDDLESDIPF